jgi:hypothetical protein
MIEAGDAPVNLKKVNSKQGFLATCSAALQFDPPKKID